MSAQQPFITFDLSGFLAVPQSIKVLYQTSWNTFERIQAYNAGISTIRSQGDTSQTYYIYSGNDEMNSFTIGRFLHAQRYPTSNWLPVSKD
jgi:hypothetical protein